jgi:hypothetical protein
VLPSPLSGRVGVHITTFEACSSFTRVTACRVAHLPYVSFIARLALADFSARALASYQVQPTTSLGGSFPWVICAVEAHPISPFFTTGGSHTRGYAKMRSYLTPWRRRQFALPSMLDGIPRLVP